MRVGFNAEANDGNTFGAEFSRRAYDGSSLRFAGGAGGFDAGVSAAAASLGPIQHDPSLLCCTCAACSMPMNESSDLVSPLAGPLDASLDGLAGGTQGGKPIFSAAQIAAYLNRTGGGWIDGVNDSGLEGRQNNIRDDNSVITFGFFDTLDQVANNGYTYVGTNAQGAPTLFGLNEYFNFAPLTAAQRAATREAIQSWDDVAAVTFREVSADLADLNFGNLANAPTTQAYARIPSSGLDTTLGGQVREIGGDTWISASQASNFQLDEGGYGLQTLVHEAGHGLGLSHPGAYNAAPGVSITYAANAEYAQDTRAYTVMSYFNASSLGARHFDFHISTTAFAGVPLIHDILAIQRIYGADMTTRTGDTTYGFNSNAGRDAYDFNLTPAPIIAIWDAGGIDTIDTSGYATRQIIDLTPGSLSSIGGVTFATAPSFEQVNINRAAAGFTAITRATYDSNMLALQNNPEVGRLTDNVGIAYGVTIENAIGGSGADTIIGNSVDNILRGNGGNDAIGGGAGNDRLFGGDGNDDLDGGSGLDVLDGGTGDDTFTIDNAGDSVIERAGEGTDLVRSSVDYTLADNVENLLLIGSALNGTGNGGINTITGNDLANRLVGGGGADVLVGNGGNDVLDGGTGNDQLTGGLGDDQYIVDSALDVVIELAGGGTDTVLSSVDLTLADNAENLTLTGWAVSGTGNGANNVITGNNQANILSGGMGDDRLIGGNGRDIFTGGAGADVFVAERGAENAPGRRGFFSTDTITDFTSGTDKIDLTGLPFSGVEVTDLSANRDAGDISFRLFDSVGAAEAALGYDIDGIDGASTYAGPVTVVYINIDGGSYDIALSLLGNSGVTASDFLYNGVLFQPQAQQSFGAIGQIGSELTFA